jgi:hypothetical protein
MKKLLSICLFTTLTYVAAQEITFTGTAGYMDGDWATVIGVVKNTTSQPLEYIQIISSFYDSDGNYLANDYSYTMLDVLLPGESSPFSLATDDITEFEKYDYTAQANIADETPVRNIEVVNQRGYFDGDWYTVSGQVKNNNTFPVEYVEIIITGYDTNKKVILVDYTYAELDALQSGQISPFEASTDEYLGEIDSYTVQTQASPLRQ